MSPCGTISIDPESMTSTAVDATAYCTRATMIGARLSALGELEGAEDLMAEVMSVAARFGPEGEQLVSLTAWLLDRVSRAGDADAGGTIGDALPLVPGTPWAGTTDPNDHRGPDVLVGLGQPLAELAVGLAKSGYLVGSYGLEKAINTPLSALSGRLPSGLDITPPKFRFRDNSAWRKEFETGLDYAREHPKEFAKLLAQDQIAYKEWQKNDKDFAAGKVAGSAFSLLFAISKVGAMVTAANKANRTAVQAASTATLARAAERQAVTARTAAQTERNGLNGQLSRRPGERQADFEARQRTRIQERVTAERGIHRADDAHAEARTRRTAAESAATQRNAERDARVAKRDQEIAKVPKAAKDIIPDAGGTNGSVHSVIGGLSECDTRPLARAR